jgi:ATP-dependent RNA circularization protein (DNA/RNA ligase family)
MKTVKKEKLLKQAGLLKHKIKKLSELGKDDIKDIVIYEIEKTIKQLKSGAVIYATKEEVISLLESEEFKELVGNEWYHISNHYKGKL